MAQAGEKAPKGKREAAVEARREKVLAAAERLFLQKGYSATSTRDIARAAGVPQGNLFNLFGTKEKIFDIVIERHAPTGEMEHVVALFGSPEFPGNFKEILRALRDLIDRNMTFVRLSDIDGVEFSGRKTLGVMMEGYGRVYLPLMELYREHLARGLVRPFNPDIALPILGISLMAVFVVRHRFNTPALIGDLAVDEERILTEMADMILLWLLPRNDPAKGGAR